MTLPKTNISKAYNQGFQAYGDPNATNPYTYFNHDAAYEDDSELADAWDEGYSNAEQHAGEAYAESCDSSMRDCYE